MHVWVDDGLTMFHDRHAVSYLLLQLAVLVFYNKCIYLDFYWYVYLFCAMKDENNESFSINFLNLLHEYLAIWTGSNRDGLCQVIAMISLW